MRCRAVREPWAHVEQSAPNYFAVIGPNIVHSSSGRDSQNPKDPNNRVAGPKYNNINGIWALEPLKEGIPAVPEASWGFPIIRGYLFGSPYNEDYSILGSILGYLNFGKLPSILPSQSQT